MPLIQINADLTRACDLLGRIAIAAERIAGIPKKTDKPEIRQTQAHDIGKVNLIDSAMHKIRAIEKQYGGK